uniref:Uncharacterized protein n=1 Tax=Cannabis sativa TaxID=3483 RepID=A0A803PZM8_CANSA
MELKAVLRRRQHTIGARWLRQGLMARGESSGGWSDGDSTVKGTTSGGIIGGHNQGKDQFVPRSVGLEGAIRGVDLGINASKSPFNSMGSPANYGTRDIGMNDDINDDLDGDLIVL